MNPVLLDPTNDVPPPGSDNIASAYITGIALAGVPRMISNVATELRLLQYGERLLPVTIDNGEIGGSYVCHPHSAYALYAREELNRIDIGWARYPAVPLLALLDFVLRTAGINRIVHLDNWMLSTNLHGDWHGEGLPEMRRLLTQKYPKHLLAIRSVDAWSSPELLQAARDDGWTLIPSRQVWVVDDLARDWLPRHNYKNDKRTLHRSGLLIEDLAEMSESDAARIAELYRLLYVGKYSGLNPVFTPAYIHLTHRTGMLDYRVARSADGTIMAVAGMLIRSGTMTPPVVGYDTTRPRSEALYRIACYLFMERACERGWRLHGSAGAAHFKRKRGAHGMIEYSAFYLGHVPYRRQFVVCCLAQSLSRLLVPIMQARGL